MRALVPLAVSLLAAPALAMDPIEVQLVGQVLAGKRPQVVVVAHAPVANLKLDLVRSGCAAGEVHERRARVGGGKTVRFDLPQPEGRCHYEGALSAVIGGQEASMPLAFDAEIAGAPKVALMPGGVDLAAHVVHVTFNREADRGVVVVRGEDGRVESKTEEELGDARPGDPLALDFRAEGTPLEVEVTVFDSGGLHGGLALFPWTMSIPHQEVEFPSGSAEIPAAQADRLQDSAAKILAALRRIGGAAPLRLFVAGYTDTVGGKAQNQALSEARARSIGAWFHAHGVQVPILTAGLGEEALAVATPDETPEAENRRAEYILAVDPPPIRNAPRDPTWQPLR